MLSGSSLTSSKSSEPPLAVSKRPGRLRLAPVKAPAACPNNSDSMRLSGIAEQLTATKGPARRGLASWMARATSSLPVPLSPSMRTLAAVGATFSMSASTSAIRLLVPTMRDSPLSPLSCARRTRFSLKSVSFSRAFWVSTRVSSTLNGLS